MKPKNLDFDNIAKKVELIEFLRIMTKDQTIRDVLIEHKLTFHKVRH